MMENNNGLYRRKVLEGQGTADIYQIFQGVQMIMINIRSSSYCPVMEQDSDVLEINYCYQGRAECRMLDGCSQYVGEGDVFLSTVKNHSSHIEFPLGYYKGIVILIDPNVISPDINNYLPGIPFAVSEIADRFFANDECFLIQGKRETEHLFLPLYSVPEEARTALFRLKILELFIYLHYFDCNAEKQKGVYTRQQVEIAKQVEKKMTEMPDQRYTIDELAKEYCISPTALKTYFKGVYGKPIAAYMKEYRIKYAASLLRDTNDSAGEIAVSVGYESQSKFGAAFKDVMKMTPLEYRSKFT